MIEALELIVNGLVEGYNFIVSALTWIQQALDLLLNIWSNPAIPYGSCIILSIIILIIKFILRKGT